MGSTLATPADRPKRLLSIDGGGLLGLIPAEALVEVERQLDAIAGQPAPLCDRFDLIGGTSTGAILAAGLALGLKADQLRDFYLKFGKDIFTKCFFMTRIWHSYPSEPLEKHLKDVFGADTTLGSDRLHTNILIVSKNATQGTTWFFTNNKKGKYYPVNSKLPLWQVVRSSTAAPTYFPPQPISIPDASGNAQNYEFVDGGVSTYNNPSLQLFLEATDPAYQFGWPTGPDKLLLLSLGTGFNTVTIPPGAAAHFNVLDWARYTIKELMGDANLQQNVLMHLIGAKPIGAASPAAAVGSAPDAPNVSALDAMSVATAKLLTYQRITIGLTRERLDGLGLKDIDPYRVREMDAADQITNMQRVGQAVAKEQVKMEVLKKFFM
jgi:hypothetical protein